MFISERGGMWYFRLDKGIVGSDTIDDGCSKILRFEEVNMTNFS